MNFLNDYPKARKVLYAVQWVLGGVTTVLGAYFVLAGYAVEDLPQWYVIGNGILPILWTYLGLQAGANTPSNAVPPPYEGPGDRGATNVLYVVGAGLLLLAFILLVTTLLKVFAVSIPVLVVLAVIGLVLLFVSGAGGLRRF